MVIDVKDSIGGKKFTNTKVCYFKKSRYLMLMFISISGAQPSDSNYAYYKYDIALIRLAKSFKEMSPICLSNKFTSGFLKQELLVLTGIFC